MSRRVISGPPIKVEYELTPTGRGFKQVAEAVREWGAKILEARAESAARAKGATKARRKSGARATSL